MLQKIEARCRPSIPEPFQEDHPLITGCHPMRMPPEFSFVASLFFKNYFEMMPASRLELAQQSFGNARPALVTKMLGAAGFVVPLEFVALRNNLRVPC